MPPSLAMPHPDIESARRREPPREIDNRDAQQQHPHRREHKDQRCRSPGLACHDRDVEEHRGRRGNGGDADKEDRRQAERVGVQAIDACLFSIDGTSLLPGLGRDWIVRGCHEWYLLNI
jgi:hypothetical protein